MEGVKWAILYIEMKDIPLINFTFAQGWHVKSLIVKELGERPSY